MAEIASPKPPILAIPLLVAGVEHRRSPRSEVPGGTNTILKPLTLRDVVDRTRLPAATIHHYLRMGLLPPPRRTAGNRFMYDERHVRAALLVRALRTERRLSLPTIRRSLPQLLRLGQRGLRPAAWDEVIGRAGIDPVADRLVSTAVRLFSRNGLAETTIAQIAGEAGVAKGTTYRHYRSKEDLFFAAAEAAAKEAAPPIIPTAMRKVRASDPKPSSRQLRPYLPMFLDLAAGAMRRRRGFRAALARVLHHLDIEEHPAPHTLPKKDAISTALGEMLATL